jgi:hypothetical protein
MRITDIPPCASGVETAQIVDIAHLPLSFWGKPFWMKVENGKAVLLGVTVVTVTPLSPENILWIFSQATAGRFTPIPKPFNENQGYRVITLYP